MCECYTLVSGICHVCSDDAVRVIGDFHYCAAHGSDEAQGDAVPLDRPSALEYLEGAKREYEDEGDIEVDIPTTEAEREALISRGDESGSYVRAWVFVYDEEARGEPVTDEERSNGPKRR